MAFSDNVRGKKNLGGIFVVRILGLPYLFSHVALPSQWDDGSGTVTVSSETYEWSNSLILSSSVGSTSSQLEPKAGTVKNGGMDLTFARAGTHRDPASDLWLNLLCNNRKRSDGLISTVAEDLDATETSIQLTSNPWSGAETLYVGRETMKKAAGAGNPITVTRGGFGAWATRHQGVVEDPGVAGGQTVGLSIADFPLDLTGRFIQVFFCPGEWIQEGELRFYAADPLDDAENRIIFVGPIVDVSEGGSELNKITVQANSLDALFDGPACSNYPRATPFTSDIRNNQGTVTSTYIGNHNKWFHCAVGFNGVPVGATIAVLDAASISDGDTLTIAGTTFTFRAVPSLSTDILIITSSNQSLARSIYQTLRIYTLDITGGVVAGWGVEQNSAIGPYVVVSQTEDRDTPKAWSVSTASSNVLLLSGATLLDGGVDADIELLNLDLTTASNITADTWVSPSELSAAVTELLTAAFGDTFVPRFWVSQTQNSDGSLGKYQMNFYVFPPDISEVLGGVTFTYIPAVGNAENKFKDFGFLDQTTGAIDPERTRKPIVIEAQKRAALFRWPAPNFTTPERLWVKDFPSDTAEADFVNNGALLFFDDTGTDIPPTIKLGDHEIVTGTSFGSGVNSRFLSGIRRGTEAAPLYNSLPDEELYVEAKDDGKSKRFEALRVPAFRGCSAELMMLFLLMGGRGAGGGYDKGWRGFGLGLPDTLVDIGSFARYIGQSARDNWVILPGDDLRDILADESLLTQRFVVVENGQLKRIDLLPPTELDAADATLVLDQSVIDSTRIGFDRKTNRIANVCEAQLNFNNANGKFLTEATSQQVDSVANYGAKRPVPLKVRGLADVRGGADILTIATAEIYGQHAEPTTIIELDVCSFDLWPSSVGDVLLVTHPHLPSPTSASLGVVELACRVHALEHRWVPGDGEPFTRVTLITDAYRGRRSSIWAPSALLLATSDGGTTWTVDDNAFGDGNPKDIEYFRVGMQVRVCQRDNLSLAGSVVREIDGITLSGTADASTITLSAAYVGDTADVVLWFADYDNASLTDRQKAHAYMSDGDGKLDAAVDDPAYVYV